MRENNDHSKDEERSAVNLLQDIGSGSIDPKLLDRPSRQKCIEALKNEGRTISQIAHFLACSEKTIGRDLKAIREKNSITPNVEFFKESVGELRQIAMTHHSYLMRLARDKDATTAEKVQAEFAAWRVIKEWFEKMQSSGYFPLKPQGVTGDIYHHIVQEEGGESIGEAKRMLIEIECVAKDTDTYTPELVEQIKELGVRIEKAEAVSEVKKLKEDQQKQITKKENEDEE